MSNKKDRVQQVWPFVFLATLWSPSGFSTGVPQTTPDKSSTPPSSPPPLPQTSEGVPSTDKVEKPVASPTPHPQSTTASPENGTQKPSTTEAPVEPAPKATQGVGQNGSPKSTGKGGGVATPPPSPVPNPQPVFKLSPFIELKEPIILKPDQLQMDPVSIGDPIVVGTRGDQIINFPTHANGAHKDVFLFQRRFQTTDRFKANVLDRGQDFEVPRNTPFIMNALVYCPATHEVIFQSPPIDSSGKYVSLNKGRRLHLYNLTTHGSQVIWSRPSDLKGMIAPKMTATPDCSHIAISLALETKEGGFPYGELYHIQRPKSPGRGEEWPATKLMEARRNLSGFDQLQFLGQRDKNAPRGAPPPQLLAIATGGDEATPDQLFRFRPLSSQVKKDGTYVLRWSRSQVGLAGAQKVVSIESYNHPTSAFILAKGSALHSSGAAQTLVFGLNDGAQPIVGGDGVFVTSIGVDALGNRLALGYVATAGDKAQSAGVVQISLLSPPTLKVTKILQVQPYQQLTSIHDPNPVYSMDDNSLYMGHPQISEQLDPTLLEMRVLKKSAKPEGELQFPVQLLRFSDLPL